MPQQKTSALQTRLSVVQKIGFRALAAWVIITCIYFLLARQQGKRDPSSLTTYFQGEEYDAALFMMRNSRKAKILPFAYSLLGFNIIVTLFASLYKRPRKSILVYTGLATLLLPTIQLSRFVTSAITDSVSLRESKGGSDAEMLMKH